MWSSPLPAICLRVQKIGYLFSLSVALIATLPSPAQEMLSDVNHPVRIGRPFLAAPQASSVSFGSVNVGSTSTPAAIIFTNTSVFPAQTAASHRVLTTGVTGLDFNDAGGSTCVGPIPYGQSCYVVVTFTPKFAGLSKGAVTLLDPTGAILDTAYISGTGTGPQLSYLPFSQGTISTGSLSSPALVALDGRNDLFLSMGSKLVKETGGSGSYTEMAIGNGFTTIGGFIADGAGNLYVTDNNSGFGGGRILKETQTSSGTYTQTVVVSGLNFPGGIAVDATGNLYVSDSTTVYKESLSSSGIYTQSVVTSGFTTVGVAVDGAGALYIADNTNQRVVKEVFASGTYTQTVVDSGFGNVAAIAVGPTGEVYVLDSTNAFVDKEAPSGTGYTKTPLAINTLLGPSGLAVDEAGNPFIANLNGLLKIDTTVPSTLTFGPTEVGTYSGVSTATLQNTGNANLNFQVPSAGTNPSLSSLEYTIISGSSSCPLLMPSSAAASLAPGASCTVGVDFVPDRAGTLTSTLTFTDNANNVAAAQQSITLSGSAYPGTVSVGVSNVSINYGSSPTNLTAYFAAGGVGPTGTVTFSIDGGPALNATCTVSSSQRTCSVAFATATIGSGTHTITASEAADANYYAATGTATLRVNGSAPTITFTVPTHAFGDPPFTVAATSNSTGAFTYTVLSGPATIARGTSTVTLTGAGTVVLQAAEAAAGPYNAATKTTSFLVTGAAAPKFAPAVTRLTGATKAGSLMAAIGRFSLDGVPDIVVANLADSTIGILVDPGYRSATPITKAVGYGPYGIVTGDFAGTGHSDVVTANNGASTITYLQGNGSTTFGLPRTFNVGTNPYGVSTADFNNDGKPDVAVADYGSNTLSILLNKPGSIFAPAVSYSVGNSPMGSAVGDFNKDGYSDIAVWNVADNTVSILLNDKTGKFLPQITYPTGTDPYSIAVGDFNHDGYPDLAVVNLADNTVSILLNDKTGSFLPQVTYPTGTEPTSIVALDLNGDGYIDLAVTNLGDNTVGVLRGNGDGTFLPQVTYPTDAEPYGLLAADLNGDNKTDLIVTSFVNRRLSILLHQ